MPPNDIVSGNRSIRMGGDTMPKRLLSVTSLVLAACLGQAQAADDTFKIGYVDPLSGTFAQQGGGRLTYFADLFDVRKEDRQILEPLYAAQFVKDVKYDSGKAGFGWNTVMAVEAEDPAQPTVCKMKPAVS